MEDESKLTQLERDVLRTVGIARKAGDVRFLLQGGAWSMEEIVSALDTLADLALAVEDASGFWTQSAKGQAVLQRVDEWELVVEDTFDLSGIGTVVKGQLITGEVYAGDFFRIDGGGLGRIISIEFLPWRDSDPSLAFRSDTTLTPGQRLTRVIPEAGAPSQ